MGALQHSIQKKQHRERSQVQSRQKYGLLEKKKDYKLRAQDYHAKQAQLKLLQRKADERNPDEYYHQMTRTRVNENSEKVRVNAGAALSVDAAKLLKSQDEGYVRTLLGREKKVIERLQSELVTAGKGKHTVFVDSENDAKSFSAAKFFDTDKSLVNRRENRLRRRQLEVQKARGLEDNEKLEEEINKERLQKLTELDQRMDREVELSKVKLEMDLQREVMKKGPKMKHTDSEGNVTFTWTKQRKR